MNRRIALATAALALSLAAPSFAQQAVVDVKAIAQAKATVDQLQQQLATLKQQYSAMSGTGTSGSLLNDPRLRTLLPADWRSVYDQTGNGGLQGISSSAATIAGSQTLTGTTDQMQGQVTQRSANLAATNKAMGLQAYDAAEGRLNNIEGLLGQVNSTTTIKQATDLHNRIAIEQSRIANENTKMQLMAMLQKNEAELANQQKEAVGRQIFSSANTSVPSASGAKQ